jgi:CheY-like chemotaxis protein
MNQIVGNLDDSANYGVMNGADLNAINAALSPYKLRVLVVEDDEADAYLIRKALDSNPRVGEILLAKDGVAALELLDHMASPDLAIVDLHMPRKDGFALLLDFAARDTHFPSVVLTSSRSGADSLRSRKRGADAFLTKPNTIEKLANALDEVIATI